MMRRALEFLTNKTFVKIRPAWLKNPATNRCLEIDAWSEELKLACEFQGYQHSVFPNCFHKSYEEFERQQARDKFKAEKLRTMGIRLLEVPHTVQAVGIPSFLAEHLSRWDLLWPRDANHQLSIITELSIECELDLAIARPPSHIEARTASWVDMSGCAPLKLVRNALLDQHPEWTPVCEPQQLEHAP